MCVIHNNIRQEIRYKNLASSLQAISDNELHVVELSFKTDDKSAL